MFFKIIFFLISCSTVLPADKTVLVIGELPDTAIIHWMPFAEGIDYCAGKLSNKRIEFHALRIDLSSPRIEIFAA
ncbi:MAG: hypothetical protein FWH41_07575, partial [Treponema sp.]|nr:hypothetical protein [Treponema sp.]